MNESKLSNLILVIETWTGNMHCHYIIWHHKPGVEMCSYYDPTPFLAVWIIWPGLVPDEPDGWTFPDASPSASTGIGAECKEGTGTGDAKSEDADTGTVKGLGVDYEVKYIGFWSINWNAERMPTTDEVSKDGPNDIDNDNSDSVYNSGTSGPSCSNTSGLASKSSYSSSECESNTKEFKDDWCRNKELE